MFQPNYIIFVPYTDITLNYTPTWIPPNTPISDGTLRNSYSDTEKRVEEEVQEKSKEEEVSLRNKQSRVTRIT